MQGPCSLIEHLNRLEYFSIGNRELVAHRTVFPQSVSLLPPEGGKIPGINESLIEALEAKIAKAQMKMYAKTLCEFPCSEIPQLLILPCTVRYILMYGN